MSKFTDINTAANKKVTEINRNKAQLNRRVIIYRSLLTGVFAAYSLLLDIWYTDIKKSDAYIKGKNIIKGIFVNCIHLREGEKISGKELSKNN